MTSWARVGMANANSEAVPAAVPAALDASRGAYVVPRALHKSEQWCSLTAPQKVVAEEILFAAPNYLESEVIVAGVPMRVPVGCFIDSQEEIGRRVGASRQVVRDAVRKLLAWGWIAVREANPMPNPNSNHKPGRKPHLTTVRFYFESQAFSRKENHNSNHNFGAKGTPSNDVERRFNEKPLSTSSTVPLEQVDSIERVFGHWQQVMRKPRAKLDEERRKLVRKRLADGYTEAQLKRAVDGCRRDPFSMGQNDKQTPYNDLSLICRDAAHVDKFIAIADRHQGVAEHGTPKETETKAPESPAEKLWARVLERIERDGKQYALEWLGSERVRASEISDGALNLTVPDKFFAEWLRDQYGELVSEALSALDACPVRAVQFGICARATEQESRETIS